MLTFIGNVTPVMFQGASPVFIDCDRESWNLDPGLPAEELTRSSERGLCLPSGTAMANGDLDRVIETILKSKK